jgi:hypothetical protein
LCDPYATANITEFANRKTGLTHNKFNGQRRPRCASAPRITNHSHIRRPSCSAKDEARRIDCDTDVPIAHVTAITKNKNLRVIYATGGTQRTNVAKLRELFGFHFLLTGSNTPSHAHWRICVLHAATATIGATPPSTTTATLSRSRKNTRHQTDYDCCKKYSCHFHPPAEKICINAVHVSPLWVPPTVT